MNIIILQEAVKHQSQAVTFGSLTVCQYRTIERIAKRILNRISCRNEKIGNFYTTATTGNYRQRLLSVIRLHRLHALSFGLVHWLRGAVASEQHRKLDPSLKRSLINPLANALIATFEIRKAVQKKNLDFVLKSRTHPPIAGVQDPQSENLRKKSIFYDKILCQ